MASINKENVRKVTNALRDGPKRLCELQRLGLNIEKRTLINILHYLEYWKFAKKDEYTGEWYLLTNHIIELRDVAEYQAMLEHSRFLLSALQKILNEVGEYRFDDISTTDPLLDLSSECLLEHLKSGYRETHIASKIEKYEEDKEKIKGLKDELSILMIENLKALDIPLHTSEKRAFEELKVSTEGLKFSTDGKYCFITELAKFLAYYPNNRVDLEYNANLSILKKGGLFIAYNISKKDAENIERMINGLYDNKDIRECIERIVKDEDNLRELERDINDKLLEIYASIKAGKIIDGRCHLCPNIKD